mmetsp:Transcript_8928/g.27734  ORF Transcript_8928/g.27734 Transcript_8928/m.27734 type:complete len:210 (-) Transcript_8928:168-797(-)
MKEALREVVGLLVTGLGQLGDLGEHLPRARRRQVNGCLVVARRIGRRGGRETGADAATAHVYGHVRVGVGAALATGAARHPTAVCSFALALGGPVQRRAALLNGGHLGQHQRAEQEPVLPLEVGLSHRAVHIGRVAQRQRGPHGAPAAACLFLARPEGARLARRRAAAVGLAAASDSRCLERLAWRRRGDGHWPPGRPPQERLPFPPRK